MSKHEDPGVPDEETEILVPQHQIQQIQVASTTPGIPAAKIPETQVEGPPQVVPQTPDSKPDAGTPIHGPLQELVERLESQNDLARRIAQLSAVESAPPPVRWYDRPVLVGFLGTLLAVVVPSVTAIDGCLSKSTELELARQRLTHEISKEYVASYAHKEALAQALNPSLSPTHRFRALRFLMKTAPDAPIQEWARAEYAIAEDHESSVTLERAVNRGLQVNPPSDDSPRPDGELSASPDVPSSPDEVAERSTQSQVAEIRRASANLADQKNPSKARQDILKRLEVILLDPNLSDIEKGRALNEQMERLTELATSARTAEHKHAVMDNGQVQG